MTITAERDSESAAVTPPLPAAETIEIEVMGTYRVRVGAGFDIRALTRVLDVLGHATGTRMRVGIRSSSKAEPMIPVPSVVRV